MDLISNFPAGSTEIIDLSYNYPAGSTGIMDLYPICGARSTGIIDPNPIFIAGSTGIKDYYPSFCREIHSDHRSDLGIHGHVCWVLLSVFINGIWYFVVSQKPVLGPKCAIYGLIGSAPWGPFWRVQGEIRARAARRLGVGDEDNLKSILSMQRP